MLMMTSSKNCDRDWRSSAAIARSLMIVAAIERRVSPAARRGVYSATPAARARGGGTAMTKISPVGDRRGTCGCSLDSPTPTIRIGPIKWGYSRSGPGSMYCAYVDDVIRWRHEDIDGSIA